MEFFAAKKEPQKKKIVYKDILSRCTQCHFSEPKLASLWQDREWNELLVSSEKLKKTHAKNLAVLEFIDSSSYKKGISKFVKDMKFFALNILKVEIKEDNITFVYEADNADTAEAKQLFKQIKRELLKYNIDKKILLHVSKKHKSPSSINSLASIITLTISPTFSKTLWSIKIDYNGKISTSSLEVENITTLDNRFDNEPLFDKMDMLIYNAFKQHNKK